MKVWPKNDEMRKLLRHPTAGAFREAGPSDWPDDTFTYRRLQDGDITTTSPSAAASPKTRKRSEPTDGV